MNQRLGRTPSTHSHSSSSIASEQETKPSTPAKTTSQKDVTFKGKNIAQPHTSSTQQSPAGRAHPSGAIPKTTFPTRRPERLEATLTEKGKKSPHKSGVVHGVPLPESLFETRIITTVPTKKGSQKIPLPHATTQGEQLYKQGIRELEKKLEVIKEKEQQTTHDIKEKGNIEEVLEKYLQFSPFNKTTPSKLPLRSAKTLNEKIQKSRIRSLERDVTLKHNTLLETKKKLAVAKSKGNTADIKKYTKKATLLKADLIPQYNDLQNKAKSFILTGATSTPSPSTTPSPSPSTTPSPSPSTTPSPSPSTTPSPSPSTTHTTQDLTQPLSAFCSHLSSALEELLLLTLPEILKNVQPTIYNLNLPLDMLVHTLTLELERIHLYTYNDYLRIRNVQKTIAEAIPFANSITASASPENYQELCHFKLKIESLSSLLQNLVNRIPGKNIVKNEMNSLATQLEATCTVLGIQIPNKDAYSTTEKYCRILTSLIHLHLEKCMEEQSIPPHILNQCKQALESASKQLDICTYLSGKGIGISKQLAECSQIIGSIQLLSDINSCLKGLGASVQNMESQSFKAYLLQQLTLLNTVIEEGDIILETASYIESLLNTHKNYSDLWNEERGDKPHPIIKNVQTLLDTLLNSLRITLENTIPTRYADDGYCGRQK